jgi:thymidine kinase
MSLELIIGPMFSGKTTYLISYYERFKYTNNNIMVINHSSDKRYDEKEMTTHSGRHIPSINVSTLSDIFKLDEYKDTDIILVNEGQFFSDLFDCICHFVDIDHKKVYVCGLDGDFRRNPIGDILRLIPYADNIIKLHAICMNCRKNDAIFTRKLEQTSCQQIEVGGIELYKPVCRYCYYKNT